MKKTLLCLAVAALLLPAGLTMGTAITAAATTTAESCGPAGPARTVTGHQLDPEQLANAQLVIATTAARGMPAQAAVIALATALQESGLRNLPHGDRDSLGLFQQRATWGPASTRLDPVAATGLFLDALTQVPDWASAAGHRRLRPGPTQRLPVGGRQMGDPRRRPGRRARRRLHHHRCTNGPGRSGAAGVVPRPRRRHHQPIRRRRLALTARSPPPGWPRSADPKPLWSRSPLAQLGKPYVWGATGPGSFDCSGLTMRAWAAAGVPIPRTTYLQVDTGTPIGSTGSLAPGDLLFTPGTGTAARPGHVGLYIGTINGNPALVQAPRTGKTVEDHPAVGVGQPDRGHPPPQPPPRAGETPCRTPVAHTQPTLTGGDLALLVAVLLVGLAVVDVLAGGALAGLLFGGGWAWPNTTDLPRTILGLLAQPGGAGGGLPTAAARPGARAGRLLGHHRRPDHTANPGCRVRRRLRPCPAGPARAGPPPRCSPGDDRRRRRDPDRALPRPTGSAAGGGLRPRDRAGAGRQDHPDRGRADRRRPRPRRGHLHQSRPGAADRAHHPRRWPLARVRPGPAAVLARPVPVGRRRRLPRRTRGAHPRPRHGRRPTPTRGPQRQLLRRRQRNRAPLFAARRRPREPVHARRARLGPRLHRRHAVPDPAHPPGRGTRLGRGPAHLLPRRRTRDHRLHRDEPRPRAEVPGRRARPGPDLPRPRRRPGRRRLRRRRHRPALPDQRRRRRHLHRTPGHRVRRRRRHRRPPPLPNPTQRTTATRH